MKKLIIIPVLALNMLANGTHIQDKEALIAEYKKMFQKISQKRIGIEESKIDRLKAPFVEVKKEIKKIDPKSGKSTYEEPFDLQAVFGNKVKMNGHWYKLGDSVNGMKIISVNDNFVWLRNKKFRKKIFIGSKNEKISIK